MVTRPKRLPLPPCNWIIQFSKLKRVWDVFFKPVFSNLIVMIFCRKRSSKGKPPPPFVVDVEVGETGVVLVSSILGTAINPVYQWEVFQGLETGFQEISGATNPTLEVSETNTYRVNVTTVQGLRQREFDYIKPEGSSASAIGDPSGGFIIGDPSTGSGIGF